MATTHLRRIARAALVLASVFATASASLAQTGQIRYEVSLNGGPWSSSVDAAPGDRVEWRAVITLSDPEFAALGRIYYQPVTSGCDPDFNDDGVVFDPLDLEAFLTAFGEGPCIPAEACCDSIDFNKDGIVYDPCDIASFLTAYAGGPCTLCGE
jgi:hypothetical protein